MKTLQEQPAPTPKVDERGYMTEPSTWTPDVAETLAKEQSLGKLTDDQWKVIVHMRQYYLEFGIVPPVRKLSRETSFSLRQMKKMFPNGLAEGVCKIAGLPRDAIKPSFLYP
ncbi:MAG: TusE/DsrC/DsvC family sulfur relay protein [Candidatus Latescibacteria bacterium]|jgi:dissimilatory sulfite reductase related protein|nr:TusE/DsrC/DsvC family sulfur relay protein [Candidatus Latescibacterota bacterium]